MDGRGCSGDLIWLLQRSHLFLQCRIRGLVLLMLTEASMEAKKSTAERSRWVPYVLFALVKTE